jgi:hypothetical protein
MNDSQQSEAERGRSSARIDAICNSIRAGLENASDLFKPPEAASNHFRQARIEVLRGIRAIIDYRIERLSRSENRGTRVAVE